MEIDVVKFAAALFSVVSPISNVPLFLAVTEGDKEELRHKIAFQAVLAVAIVLSLSSVFGHGLLRAFGVSIAAFSAAGGIILLRMALSMLKAEPSKMHRGESEDKEGVEKPNPAVFPLAIPNLAGPGAISTVILFSDQCHSIAGHMEVITVILAISLVLLLCLWSAVPVASYLGKTGMNVFTRIMGIILASIAIEMIAKGLTKLWPGLAG